MQAKWIIFLEVLGLVGAVAFFNGVHSRHLNELQTSLTRIEQSVEASNYALQSLQNLKEEVACARAETDRKLLEAPDGDMCYEYYGRLLREDAERRGHAASDGTHVPMH